MMKKTQLLADYQNPQVREIALELTQNEPDLCGKDSTYFQICT